MKRIIGILAICIAASSLTACKKYENGGSLNKAEDNLTSGAWKLNQYLRNGVDETSQLLISGFTETFASGGILSRSYIDTSGDPYSESGDWSLDSDKQEISISSVSSIELTAETITVSTSQYIIVKLTKDDLWYNYENGGDNHEFHLIH